MTKKLVSDCYLWGTPIGEDIGEIKLGIDLMPRRKIISNPPLFQSKEIEKKKEK